MARCCAGPGNGRAAASRLRAAREQLSALDARPDLERCDRELAACGLTPAKRSEIDPTRLTAQESAVAGLVATGMSNREVATELFVSIKTVQFHLTRIYAKLGIHSRAELAAQSGDQRVDTLGSGDCSVRPENLRAFSRFGDPAMASGDLDTAQETRDRLTQPIVR
jgi:DNA-binding CsgD family transcriptional regulator